MPSGSINAYTLPSRTVSITSTSRRTTDFQQFFDQLTIEAGEVVERP